MGPSWLGCGLRVRTSPGLDAIHQPVFVPSHSDAHTPLVLEEKAMPFLFQDRPSGEHGCEMKSEGLVSVTKQLWLQAMNGDDTPHEVKGEVWPEKLGLSRKWSVLMSGLSQQSAHGLLICVPTDAVKHTTQN